jgi:polyisoprenoid-binding protein YceI
MTTQTTAVATWTIDPTVSSAEFGIKHMTISTVKGRFGTVSGTLRFDGQDLTTASVEVTIDVASVTTNEPQRDAHLRSPDFFAVDAHPTLTFHSTGVTHVREDEYHIAGELTIRETTRPVTLDATYGGHITDPDGLQRAGFTADTTISRKAFGLSWNALLETGGVVWSDKVEVTLHIEATRNA